MQLGGVSEEKSMGSKYKEEKEDVAAHTIVQAAFLKDKGNLEFKGDARSEEMSVPCPLPVKMDHKQRDRNKPSWKVQPFGSI